MKKHIIGLVIFSFIVSAAAIGYAMFNVGWSCKLPASPYIKNAKISNSPPIRQPTLNMTSGNFIFETDCAGDSKGISLAFYEKSENDIKQFVLQHIGVRDLELCRDNTVSKKVYWTEQVAARSNLYVVAYDDAEGASANFDESRALPVLISFGKNESAK